MLGGSGSSGKRQSLLANYSGMLGDAILRQRTNLAERARRVEAERADMVKTQFIANMSHELRTPLNAIIGFSKILKDPNGQQIDAEQVQEYAEIIHDTSTQLLSIINEILDISKLLSGKYSLDRQEVLVSEILDSVVSLLALPSQEANVQLSSHVPDDLPFVIGDPVKLKQIFTNLLFNAVKFTPENGSVMVQASMVDEGVMSISISDTGIGMTENEITVALAEFEQVESEFSSDREGTGLGLPIAKALVELHGGSLGISSAKGIGTEVTIRLPLDSSQDGDAQESNCAA